MYWGIHFYRSFHFCAYPNPWFSLCMVKRNITMVLVCFLNTCTIIEVENNYEFH
uniref:At1g45904 n=1 Tax=Arabidopsis thaliana TaxID=3702 RepID=Q6NLE4_ARATH|nr:At1g45904 [Arabidopsis thaliana]AAS88780.1 At1g45904 [Arabidopsis thaliana]